jgi:hypothetical protein
MTESNLGGGIGERVSGSLGSEGTVKEEGVSIRVENHR